ncbi:gamma-aminobutyric acid type B receptor subunit 2-like [Liolophura sinensis]|uniref:gamma-aminobutyric acid type B receptor subunit 2-like n=1 Tax=Liolophura sinensis TaxID=3198878 RepID=UPI003158F8A1
MAAKDRLALLILGNCFALLLFVCQAQKQKLHIGGICTLSNHWFVHARVFPDIIRIAFDDINNNTDVLADYELVLDMVDDQGNPGLAMKGLFEYISEGPNRLMIIGPAKSEPTNAIAQVAHMWNLMSLIYSARSSDINNRAVYNSTYVVNPIDKSLNPVRLAIMKGFSWTKVATITLSTEAFSSQMSDFHQVMKNNNITVVTSSVLTENSNAYIAQHIETLKQFDARIIVANINDLYVRQVFCEAYLRGLTGRNYVWILMNWAATPGWPDSIDTTWGTPPESRCNTEQLHEAADGYLGLSQQFLSTSEEPTIAGMTPKEIADRSDRLFSSLVPGGQLPHNHPHAYDAAWAIALALNYSIERLVPLGKRLEDFTYSDFAMGQIFREGLEEIQFAGASGPVAFRPDGSRVGITFINQWRDRQMVEVGLFDEIQYELKWYPDSGIIWPGGKVPKDSFIRRYEQQELPTWLQWMFITIACAGIILTLSLLVFNIRFRNEKVIKMSSPNLNNLILTGGMLMYVVVLIASLDTKYLSMDAFTFFCNLRMWLVTLAFTVAFGSMFSKTWRVHQLFTNKSLERKVIKDSRLFIFVGLMTICDLIVLGIWIAVDTLKGEKVILPEIKDSKDDDVIIVPEYTRCHSESALWFQIAIYSYKGLLLLLGSFLAWETRQVTVPGLNDSKTIGMSVYNVTVLCAFAVPIGHVLTDVQYVIRYALLSALIVFCTTSSLALVFYPKIMMKKNKVEIGRFAGGGTTVGEPSVTGYSNPTRVIPMQPSQVET